MTKSTAVRAGRTLLLAAFLAAVLPIFLAPGALAAELQVQNATLIEITGGKGTGAWRLVYGMNLQSTAPASPTEGANWRQGITFAQAAGNRAWYGHTQWLRLIDTEKGVVLGRWQFPAAIVHLTPAGQKVSVETQDFSPGAGFIKRTFEFDPANPRIPYWPTPHLLQLNVSLKETEIGLPFGWRVPGEQAQTLLPAVEEMVRRDPTAPWFRLKLWRLRRDAGLPRDDSPLEAALATPTTNFTELLRISSFLQGWEVSDFADRFFQRGYADFLARGNDPRLFTDLWARHFIYAADLRDLPEGGRARFAENLYQLAPFSSGAEFAWLAKARLEEQKGNREQADLWHERARQASENTLDMFSGRQRKMVDRLHLVALGCAFACLAYLLVLFLRYRPQRRLDLAAWQRLGLPPGNVFGGRGWLFLAIAVVLPVLLIALFLYPATDVAVVTALLVVLSNVLVFGALYLRRRAAERKRAGLPGLEFGLLEYWSSRERVAFLLIVLIGWAALGVVGYRITKLLPAVRTEWTHYLGLGHLGSPVTRDVLLQLRRSPARDLFLATSYQQAGDSENADWLYRSLPRYAESWNNLGVMLRGQGKEQEARAAFEHALEIQPDMPEATLNLGRGARGDWAALHARYRPQEPMLAVPNRQQFSDTLEASAGVRLYLAALAGPITSGQELEYASMWIGRAGWMILQLLAGYSLVLFLGLALLLFFVIPSRVPTTGAGSAERVLEVLLPGTARAWSVPGGVVLPAWCALLAANAFFLGTGTPYLLTYAGIPYLPTFGVSWTDLPALFNPGWPVLLLAPLALFAVNLAVVLWQRK